MNSLRWYIALCLDVRTLADAIAVPKIIMGDIRTAIAQVLLDHTGKFGNAMQVESMRRWHFARAEAMGAINYCVWHACDSTKCPNDGVHTDD